MDVSAITVEFTDATDEELELLLGAIYLEFDLRALVPQAKPAPVLRTLEHD